MGIRVWPVWFGVGLMERAFRDGLEIWVHLALGLSDCLAFTSGFGNFRGKDSSWESGSTSSLGLVWVLGLLWLYGSGLDFPLAGTTGAHRPSNLPACGLIHIM